MKHVSDLMTADPFCVERGANLKDAHDLMRSKNVRHIPVIDTNGELVGMLTQKVLVAKVMSLVAQFGAAELERKEKQQLVTDIMLTDFVSVLPSTTLLEVTEYFVTNRHGCLPIVDDSNKIKGILTSSDFVRLAVILLKQST